MNCGHLRHQLNGPSRGHPYLETGSCSLDQKSTANDVRGRWKSFRKSGGHEAGYLTWQAFSVCHHVIYDMEILLGIGDL